MKNQFSKLMVVSLVVVCYLFLLGCGGGGGEIIKDGTNSGMVYTWTDGLIAPWYMPVPPETKISPLTGQYVFTPQDSSGLTLYHTETLKVDEEAGMKYVYFASDGWRFDKVQIVNGSFHNEWGLGISSWPTDAYAISGCFTGKSKAEGLYKYAGSSKNIQGRTVFTAELLNNTP